MRTLSRLVRCAALAAFMTASGLLAPSLGQAYEDMGTVGGTLGVGLAVDPDTTTPCCGPTVGVSASIGLGDTFTLRGQLEGAWHPSNSTDPTLWLGLVGVEVIYLLDIVSVVPFFGIGVDTLLTSGGGSTGIEFGAHAILGADYLLNRELAIGIDIRPRILFASAIEDGRLDPVYVSVALRLSYRFDVL